MSQNFFKKMIAHLGMVAAILVVATSMAQNQAYFGAKDPGSSQWRTDKPTIDYTSLYTTPSGREGGEVIGTAIPITGLPFNDTGYTCDNANDYDEACPYTGSVAPDVVYSFVATQDLYLDIDLCGSDYDTKVFVYLNSYTAGYPYACNDDFYNDETCGSYVSFINDMNVIAGNTYYIVIDGYGSACGNYILSVEGTEPPPPCNVCYECSSPENEPDIADYGYDVVNGGCNDTYLWSPIAVGQVICGRSNTYIGSGGGSYRDTDWYEFTLTEAGTLYVSAVANFDLQLILFTYVENCDSYSYNSTTSGGGCNVATLSAELAPGTYWVWVGPNFFEGMPGGDVYNLTLTLNDPPVPGFCSESVPVAQWAILLAIGLIAGSLAFKFGRRN